MLYLIAYAVMAFLVFLWVCSERRRDDKMLNIQNRPFYWLMIGGVVVGILWPFLAFIIVNDYYDKRIMMTRYD